jgi:hypothetical protein
VAEFLLDSLDERRAIVGDASVEGDDAVERSSPDGRSETILRFAGSGMDLSLSRKKKGGALTFVVDAICEQQQVSNSTPQTLSADLPQTHLPSNRVTRPRTLTFNHQDIHCGGGFYY